MGILPKLNATRLLLVEDNLNANERLTELLREVGYEVETAYNIGDALAAQHDRFALAVVDGAMRSRDGRSVLEMIREVESFAALPIVLADGGRNLVERVQTALAMGRERNIEKVIASVAKTATQEAIRITHESLSSTIPSDEDDDPTVRTPAAIATSAQFRQQVATLRTLSELGRSISSVLELNQVLNQIVEAATTLTSAEEGMLLLPDEDDKALYLRAKKGIDDRSAQNFRIKSDEPLVGTVYRTGEPVLIGDRGPMRLKTEYFVKSLVYVPLRSKGRVIGVLGVNNRQTPRLFSVTDLELLIDLAAYAAIAIENARLYEERLIQNRRLTTLVEAGVSVNSTLALSDVLLSICRQIIKAFEVNACLIRQQTTPSELIKPGQTSVLPENNLRDLAVQWQAIWSPGDGPRTSLEDRPALRRALTQNVSYVAQRDQAGVRSNAEVALLESFGAHQMAVLPLRTSGQTIYGVMELFYRREAPPPSQELRAHVRTIATEIYALIRVRGDFRPDGEIGTKANEVLKRTGADWLTMHILGGEGQTNQMTKVLQFGSSVFLDEPYPQTQDLPPQFKPVFQDARPVTYHMRQPNLPEPVRDLMANVGAEVMLCLPLTIKGRTVGMFVIYGTGEARDFTTEEIGLAAALIAQAATAIENARLYRDLERSLANLKQAQASLVQAARLSTMGELAAVVAHQINNPLTTIIADSEILLSDLPKDSPHREAVQAIQRSGQRANTVVKRLLSTARRNSSDEPQWVDVHQTVRNTLDLVSTHIERGRVRFEVDLDTSLPSFARALPGHLEDVWLNLLINARDALIKAPPGSAMGITTRRAAQTLDILVWDKGPGIPIEFKDRIFEPFFTTKPTGEGTGLGLYICKQVITEIGGRIGVDTSAGQGTCFRITLPVNDKGA